MEKVLRLLILGTVSIMLLAACAGQEESPTPQGTTVPADQTAIFPPVGTNVAETATALEATPNTTATIDTATLPAGADTTQIADTTQTPSVPVTGAETILLECQYCIEGVAHALLVLPDTATYEVAADTATLSTPGPDMGCTTVDTYNGRQVLICRSQANTSLNLNICTDANNCTPLLVELQTCPVIGPAGTEGTETPAAGIPTDTAVVGVTDTPDPLASPTP